VAGQREVEAAAASRAVRVFKRYSEIGDVPPIWVSEAVPSPLHSRWHWVLATLAALPSFSGSAPHPAEGWHQVLVRVVAIAHEWSCHVNLHMNAVAVSISP
jgi:hypothetical protein